MRTNSEVERFAVAQALYSKLGSLVETRGKGDLRAEVDEMLLDAMEASGANRIEIRLGGELVGELSAQTKQEYQVSDVRAWREWASERGLLVERRYVEPADIDNLEAGELDELLDYLEEHHPSVVVKRADVSHTWQGYLVHRGEEVFDAETGERIEWAKFVTKVSSTRLVGCKWEAPTKSKFVGVAQALPHSELSTTGLAGLLGGEVDG